jgi:Domain of unknown function (DUF4267)
MSKMRAGERWTAGLAIAAGVVLLVIGVRFFLVPPHAARTFGLSNPPGAFDLHYMIGVRDVWLALALVLLAAMREWRALAVVLLLGAVVCFVDAAIVSQSSGKVWVLLFHVFSGVYCAALGGAAFRLAREKLG